jgi:hypothetical protein
MRRFAVTLVAGALVVGAAACGDDDVRKSIDEAREDVEDAVGAAGARAAAEVLRGILLARDLDEGETLRDVAVLRDAVEDLPGDPEVARLHDRSGDGKDDDGRIELRVGDQRACIEVADNGEVDVSGGACPRG